ncbi:hypothetical protein AB0E01_36585 [Nocardia vinacea]|uniref:hypothetical protein n=1 Tax=Nocardia vinacea TaxID=96468 RepID=UPI0033D12428
MRRSAAGPAMALTIRSTSTAGRSGVGPMRGGISASTAGSSSIIRSAEIPWARARDIAVSAMEAAVGADSPRSASIPANAS